MTTMEITSSNKTAEWNGIKLAEAEELANCIGERVQIRGSIYKVRKMKDFSFVLLRTRRELVQCIAEERLELPLEESHVYLVARVMSEERSRSGYELHIEGIQVLNEPFEASPIVINQKLVNTSMENLLNYRPVTLRNEKQRAIFKLQEGIFGKLWKWRPACYDLQ